MTNEFAVAVHTLVFLNHKGDCESSEKIAENVCTNPARVRKVLAKLKKTGLVVTKEGTGGGCYFDLDPSKVTLAQICRAVEDAPVSPPKKTGDVDMDCQIASGMGAVMDEIYGAMNVLCMEKLETITVLQIDKIIFG